MASSVQSSLEAAASAMGVEISDTPEFKSDSSAEVVEPTATEEVKEVKEETPVEEPEAPIAEEDKPEAEPEQIQQSSSTEDDDIDIDATFLEYLNEKMDTKFSSWDDVSFGNETPVQEEILLPESIKVIADFVEKTGRSPEDWFRYQSLNPSEMDDLSVVRLELASDFPNLSNEEISLLMDKKYKVDENMYDEQEISYSKLQLKMDADKARSKINEVRNGYMLPVEKAEPQEQEIQSPIDDKWVSTMSKVVDNMESLDFDLGKGNEFKYTIDSNYRSSLKDKNARLDEFFDQYVDASGSWDHETLSAHRTIIDNIDSIVQSAYRQGLGDGQKNIVTRAANVDASSPVQQTKDRNPVEDQIVNALLGGKDNVMKFK